MVSTNSRPTPLVIAPAVCRRIAPSPKARIAEPARYRPPPTTACIACGLLSVRSTPLARQNEESIRNETNEMTSPTTNATAETTSSFDQNTEARRGWAVSEVRIIPVEYSEVIAMAPKTTMISWPRMMPKRERWVRSSWASCAAVASPWLARPQLPSTLMPMVTTVAEPSVHMVERTDRILVHSERSAPPKPARPEAGGSAVSPPRAEVLVVISAASLLHRAGHDVGGDSRRVGDRAARRLAGHRGVVLHAVLGQLHERLLQGRLDRRELVHPDLVVEGQVADLGHAQLGDPKRVRAVGGGRAALRRDQRGEPLRLGGAHPDGQLRVGVDELLHRAVRDEPAATDHDQVLGGVLHLAHQVRGDEHGTALGGQHLHQVPDPEDALRVEAVDRLVEHQHLGVAEQRRGDAEPLAHAEREAARALLGHLAQAHQLQRLADPGLG